MERYYEFISMNPYLVGWFPTKISQILIISPIFLNLQGKRDLWNHLTSKKSPCWSNCIFTNKNLTPKNQAADQASPSGFSRSWSWKVAVRFAISPRKNTCQEKAIQLSSNKMVLQKMSRPSTSWCSKMMPDFIFWGDHTKCSDWSFECMIIVLHIEYQHITYQNIKTI